MTERTKPATLTPELEAEIRLIAREEIASLAGLVVRRTQDLTFTRSPEHNIGDEAARDALAGIFGEALNDFTTPAEPGP